MKSIGVKKLVAIAAGAALLGTAMAPFAMAAVSDLTKSDIYSSAGSPLVQVVVGSTAKASDVIWAGNIASKIAENAVTTQDIDTTVTGGTANVSAAEIAVTVGGGATTFANAKTLEDYLISSTATFEPAFDKNISIDANGTITGTSLTSSALPDLTDKTVSYKYNGSNVNITVKERISSAANPRFNAASDVEALVLDIDSASFAYVLDLGNGIPVHSSATAITAFTDTTDDHIMVPFFGKNYLVKDIDETTAGSEYMKLVESNAKKTLLPGEGVEVEGKGTYAGKTLTLVMDVLNTAGTSAKFILKDGDTVLNTVTQGTGDLDFTDNEGNDIMDTTVTVDSITATGSNTTTGVTNGYADLFVGASGLTLYNTKGYPYDSSNSTGIYDWKVNMYFSNNDTAALARTLKELKISNSNKRWNDATALKVGEEASFIGDVYSIKFQGWKDDKQKTTVKIGDQQIVYKDTSGSTHTIPMVIKLDTPSNSWQSFTFDGQTIYYDVNETDQNIKVNAGSIINGRTWSAIAGAGGAAGAGADINGILINGLGRIPDFNVSSLVTFAVDGTLFGVTGHDGNSVTVRTDGAIQFRKTSSTGEIIYTNAGDTNTTLGAAAVHGGNSGIQMFYSDATTWDTNSATTGAKLSLTGSNSQTYNYAMMVKETGKLWLLLDDQNISTEFSGNTKTISFVGTDLADDGLVDANTSISTGPAALTDTGKFYQPDDLDFTGIAASPADYVYFIAQFRVDEGTDAAAAAADGSSDWNAYIQTDYSNGDLVTLPNANLSGYSYQIQRRAGTNVQALNLRSDTPASYYASAYDDDGVMATAADGVATFVLPETRPYIQAIVKSSGTTETISGGDDGVLKVGETVTIGSTKILIKDASAITGVTVSGSDSNEPTFETVTVRAPLNGKARVVLDSSGDPGAAILVGGQKVNKLTRDLGAAISDKLAASGDYVVEKIGDKIVVAGYHAADTGTAAQALIAWLDQ